MGVPVIGCRCAVCLSDSPLNKRLRASALLELDGKKILIDAGPDFRQQALAHLIDHLDGVIFTHAHYDHTAGLDDLRVFYIRSKRSVPILASQSTLDDLKTRFAYAFTPNPYEHKLAARVIPQILEGERGSGEFAGLPFNHVTYEQAGMPVNGFRFRDLAFITDIREFPDVIYQDMKGVEILVLSALRHHPSPLHFSIDEAVAFSKRLNAKRTFLTHLAHEVDYESTNALLPPNVRLAYDGLSIEYE